MTLLDLIGNKKKISIIGLAKNTGKTVVLQKLIDELNAEKVITGITSIGHDGEKFDQINNLIEKPRIFLNKGTIIATTSVLCSESLAQINILKETDYYTPLGRVIIGIIEKGGIIEVAGPSTATGINDLSEQMLKLGASKVIIDGAINRKAISSPDYTDGIIISTGAVLSDKFDQVINESVKIIQSIIIPVFNEFPISTKNFDHTASFDERGRLIEAWGKTLLSNNGSLEHLLRYNAVHMIYTKKSITEPVIDNIALLMKKRKMKTLIILIKDHTKLFLQRKSLSFYEKKGLIIRVLYPINLLAITINPVAPLSHSFDSELMISSLKKYFNGIPILDVLKDNQS